MESETPSQDKRYSRFCLNAAWAEGAQSADPVFEIDPGSKALCQQMLSCNSHLYHALPTVRALLRQFFRISDIPEWCRLAVVF